MNLFREGTFILSVCRMNRMLRQSVQRLALFGSITGLSSRAQMSIWTPFQFSMREKKKV